MSPIFHPLLCGSVTLLLSLSPCFIAPCKQVLSWEFLFPYCDSSAISTTPSLATISLRLHDLQFVVYHCQLLFLIFIIHFWTSSLFTFSLPGICYNKGTRVSQFSCIVLLIQPYSFWTFSSSITGSSFHHDFSRIVSISSCAWSSKPQL